MSARVPPKPSKDVIYVDVDDEITGIIDKVENTSHKVVALVLPKRAASLQSIVNMKLLKRSAEDAGKNVVLITNEQALLPLAGTAGLHVAKNLQSKPEVPQPPALSAMPPKDSASEEIDADDESVDEDLPAKFDYNRPVGALAAAHEAQNPETIDLDDDEDNMPAPAAKPPKGSKVKIPNFDRFRMMLGLGTLAVVALIVFLILAIFILPKATVTVVTSSEPVSANFELTASTKTQSLDSKAGAIPAKLEKSDQTGTQQVTATGQQNNGDKATGSVTMSATKCAPDISAPNDVSSGTGVSTNGLSYITQEEASFGYNGNDGKGCIYYKTNSVSIKATQGGSKYNTSLSGASVSGHSGVTADGSASGGTDDIVTVLSQSDVDAAKDKLTGGASGDDFSKSFIQKLQDQGAYVLSSTLKTSDAKVNASPAVGQPASTATVTIKVTYTVLTVQKSDLSKAIEDKMSDQIDKTKQKLNGNFLNDANVTVQSQPSSSTALLSINENTTVVPIIDVQAVKKQAEGKKAGDIKAAINTWPGVKDVQVKLSPFWVSKVPKSDKKVTVVLQEAKDNSPPSAP